MQLKNSNIKTGIYTKQCHVTFSNSVSADRAILQFMLALKCMANDKFSTLKRLQRIVQFWISAA